MDLAMSALLGGAAIALYLYASWVEFTLVNGDAHPLRGWRGFACWLAAALHGAALWEGFFAATGVDFGFFNVMALAALLVVLLALLNALGKRGDRLGLVVFPLAAILLGLKLLLLASPHPLHETSLPMQAHILASLLAFSLLNIAAAQALLLAAQDWQLRRKHPLPLLRALPSVQGMERLLFQLIAAGFTLLSLSLLTGLAYVEDLFAQHLAHKTVLSILAWLVFALLLGGRFYYGWRGQTAIRWTLVGFATLLLAYFGSKMVLELILHRT
jgi:ABC-type uncharacterized transport system permease subunit